jgi:septum site-determining protein MinD
VIPKSDNRPEKPGSRDATAIAVVSGKGDSGKTMLAVAMAQGFALAGREVLLVDADFGTGGLSYYLTFRAFQKARVSIADPISDTSRIDNVLEWAAYGKPEWHEQRRLSNVRLVPVGDQRHIGEDVTDELLNPIARILRDARELFDVVTVDCRG